MNRIINFIMAAVILELAPTAAAQDTTVPADTLIVAENAQNVVVTQTGDVLKITVAGYGDKQATDYTYTSAVHRNDSTESDIWDLKLLKAPSPDEKWRPVAGCRAYVGGTVNTDGPVDMAYFRSVDFGLLHLVGVEYRPWRRGPRFTLGAGFGYRIVSTHKNAEEMFRLESGGEISLQPTESNVYDQVSRIEIFHLDVPFSITQPITKKWAVSVGATVNFNTYVVGAANYKVHGENEFGLTSGHKVQESYKHLYQRPVTVDLTAGIGYIGGMALYVKYSPMQVFKDGKGPQFKTLGIGVMFGF